MQILLYHPYARNTPVFEWGLEVAQRHLDRGDRVTVMRCGGEFLSCDVNPQHRYSVCFKCRKKGDMGWGLLKGPAEFVGPLHLRESDRQELAGLPRSFRDFDELTDFRIEEFEAGLAVASSLISLFREAELDVDVHAGLIADMLVTAVGVYRSIQNYLAEHPVDRVYVCNGRVAVLRAVLRACQSRKADCHVIESGRDPGHIRIFPNVMPHDRQFNEQAIRETWTAAANDPEREAIAQRWFIERSHGKEQDYVSFIKAQQAGLLPSGFDSAKHNIVIYTSSDEELTAVGKDWINPLYRDQMDGLEQICSAIDGLPPHIHCYVRMHPHQIAQTNKATQTLRGFAKPRCTIIPPEDKVCTYALMRAASTILTFGSTVGIEATYWGKPSILCGISFYQELGGTYNPRDHSEVMSLLRQTLEPKPQEAALPYGYFMETNGEKCKYFHSFDVFDGTFHGDRCSYGRFYDYAWGAFRLLPWFDPALNRHWRQQALKELLGNGCTR